MYICIWRIMRKARLFLNSLSNFFSWPRVISYKVSRWYILGRTITLKANSRCCGSNGALVNFSIEDFNLTSGSVLKLPSGVNDGTPGSLNCPSWLRDGMVSPWTWNLVLISTIILFCFVTFLNATENNFLGLIYSLHFFKY